MEIEKAESDRKHLNTLLTALTEAEKLAKDQEEIDHDTAVLNEREQKIQSATGRVNEYVEKARGLARAANTAKERLLKEVFNDTLNGMWADLFGRLVKQETFVPRLSEPVVRRGQIRASVQAVVQAVEMVPPFEQAGSVFSTANLNTAAL